MIEKCFRSGIRLKWVKPRDAIHAYDGTIVASSQLATPLIYDGLDGDLVDKEFMMVNVSSLGLTMREPIGYAWLDYAPGRTARLPVGPHDILSGYMSGCLIAFGRDKGIPYVYHVGTIDGNTEINRKVKRTFAFAMPRGATAFNPAAAWTLDEIVRLKNQLKSQSDPKIFALVTRSGDFYALVLFRLVNNITTTSGASAVRRRFRRFITTTSSCDWFAKTESRAPDRQSMDGEAVTLLR